MSTTRRAILYFVACPALTPETVEDEEDADAKMSTLFVRWYRTTVKMLPGKQSSIQTSRA